MDEAQREKSPWKRNLYILWVCTFIAGIAFSELMPFMSLYVSQLGHFSKAQVSFYSGLVYAATFLVTAIVSPLWGMLADIKGRKIMLIRASFGMAFAMFLMGPIIGGVLAQFFSIRDTFFITASLLALAGILSATLVKEYFVPIKREKNSKEHRGLLSQFQNPRLIIVLLISTMMVQLGNISIAPIISLYIKELMHNQGPIALVAGIIAALPGISNIISAPRLGAYGDAHGSNKVLMTGYLFAVIMYFPQGFVSSIWLLGILRFFIGISDGALFPTIQTLLTKNSPASATSAVFSWNQSFQALGNMFGSLLGGSLAGLFDYNVVFISTATLLLLNFLILWFTEPSLRLKFNR